MHLMHWPGKYMLHVDLHKAHKQHKERLTQGPVMNTKTEKKSVRRFAMLALSNIIAVTGLLGAGVYFFLEIDNDELVLRNDALAAIGQYGKTDPPRMPLAAKPNRVASVEIVTSFGAINASRTTVNTAAKTDVLIKFTREVVARRITPDSSFDLANAVPGKPYPLERQGTQLPSAPGIAENGGGEAAVNIPPVQPAVAVRETTEKKKKRLAQAKLKHKQRAQYCLAAAVYYESAFEPTRGKEAVAQVVLNRKASKRYPNTICGVVFQNDHMKNRCQFSFACDGRSDRAKKSKPWRAAEKVARDFLVNGKRVPAMARVTHYHADYVNPKWASSLTRVSKIGRHIFYSVPKRSKRIRVASTSSRARNGYRTYKIPAVFGSKKSGSLNIVREYPGD